MDNLQAKTEEELGAIIKAGEDASKEISRRYLEKSKVIDERINEVERGNNGRAFTEEELLYAAYARCSCGAGFAYPHGIGMRGSWLCSRILKGKAEPGSTHEAPMPFAFYEVKSENQRSANGATTRPNEEE